MHNFTLFGSDRSQLISGNINTGWSQTFAGGAVNTSGFF